MVEIMWKKVIHFLLLSLFGVMSQLAWAVDAGQHQVVDGLSVYLGVLPAEMIRGHPKEHPESLMHGGFPDDYRHHITVAVFDNDSGKRITNADVSAKIVGVDVAGPERKLESMTIAGNRTYGGYFKMPGTDAYRIEIRIRLPKVPEPTKVIFAWGRS